MENKVLRNMTAVVSGASSGIGAACAQALAADGATVLLMARKADALASTRKAILAQVPGARVEIFAGDACQESDVKRALDAAFAVGSRLDIIASCVGGASVGGIMDVDAADFTRQLQLNIVSVFHMIKQGVPLMKSGGSIVCLSSSTVPRPLPGLVTYSTTKAGLEMLVRLAGEEFGGRGIRVNAVRPGLTRSASTIDYFNNPALLNDFIKQVPLGRGGEPEDIARAVRFLAGPESAWITGHCLSADGGQSLPGFPLAPPNPG
jgi:NAD(P)-dependent dehydrogenase (short-subunit alcohol dehydrogenase family)